MPVKARICPSALACSSFSNAGAASSNVEIVEMSTPRPSRISPIVSRESLIESELWAASRYGKGGDDYLNCPLDRAGYEAFVDGLLAAELYPLKDFERDAMFFEGCLPIEEWPAIFSIT